jgi:3-oxoacyl-[acyl-carrier-protein] synthase-1
MIEKKVILKQKELLSALGMLNITPDLLLSGKTGIQDGPTFSIPVPSAPFEDLKYRTLKEAVLLLKSKVNWSSVDTSNLLFIYCAAKGDLSALEIDQQNDTSQISPFLGDQALNIAQWLELKPARALVVSSACISGAVAVEVAKEYLERGIFTTAVLFGYDVISRFVVNGFNSLSALSQKNARPFDAERNGLTLGDGTAIAVLTYDTPDKGDIIIAGTGSSNDANHRTGPSRTGEGLFRAAASALKNSETENPNIGSIKCHGTATVYNDAMEAKAITRLFSTIPPCFSLKGALGHSSGAGSLLEIILSSEFLKKRMVPPTAGFNQVGTDEVLPISNKSQPIAGDSILCLSAGFGGLNAAVVLKEYQ